MKKLITIMTAAILVTSCSTAVKIPNSMSKEEYNNLKDGNQHGRYDNRTF